MQRANGLSARYSLVPKTGGTYTEEECVKDNLTGLIWEGKTASPATTRLGTSTYTNFDSTTSRTEVGEWQHLCQPHPNRD